MKLKMTLRHNKCRITPIHLISTNSLKEKYSEDIKIIKSRTKELTDGEYSFLDDHYINSKTEHKFLYHTYVTIFKKKWGKFKDTPKQPRQRFTECYRKGMESGALVM